MCYVYHKAGKFFVSITLSRWIVLNFIKDPIYEYQKVPFKFHSFIYFMRDGDQERDVREKGKTICS